MTWIKAYLSKKLSYETLIPQPENHAKSLDSIKSSYFCAVVRPVDHPRCPVNYVPLDAICQHFGYRKYPELTTNFAWKDLDETKQSFKTMVFLGKAL
jgi:hypothetical protein